MSEVIQINKVTCSLRNCDNINHAHGMCGKHYARWIRHGDANYLIKTKSAEERFWDKVDNTGDCWEWTAATRGGGYGAFWLNGVTIPAHRFAWELANGPIPDGLFIIHSCDNPPCVNVQHLSLGTPRQNMEDTAIRARRKSKLRNLAPDIRAMRRYGWGVRQIARYFDVDHSNISRLLAGQILRYH